MAASDAFRQRPRGEGAKAFLATMSLALVGVAVAFFMVLFYLAQVASAPGPTKGEERARVFEAPRGA